jgi:hypothetical protein
LDPNDDLIYQVLTDVEWGSEPFVLIVRLADTSGGTYVQAVREGDGSYVVEQRDGSPESRRTMTVPLMPKAVALVSDWALLGRDLPLP